MAKNALKLTTLADDFASITVGLVGPGVLYARLSGSLSSGLGNDYARHLEGLVKTVPHVRYFSDASGLKQYDLLARSAFVRVVLAHRRKFTSLVMLTWAEGYSRASRAFMDTFGDGVQVLIDKAEFASQLYLAAPAVRTLIEPGRRPRTSA